ncbi:MAG: AmmeMemoRadiSam system protein B [Thermoanaerobaculum sp.]|nr:AmmeMemoRadiSam system protein B [Thermoanaerobaculum sp.]MDW7968560.1 AmmeMemoRadiSam system protein B [Thermoanaerobaculum sp.]
MSPVRPPAVAGSFYPSSPVRLRDQVMQFIGQERERAPAAALIAPHAGYLYSGATAGVALAHLPREARRVVLLGPSHYRSFAGAALPAEGVAAFATPLGEVPVDVEAVELLREHALFAGPAQAHEPEHCLEVELPFVQTQAPQAAIVPVLIGNQTTFDQTEEIAQALVSVVAADTVIVVSSDFTHHGRPYGYVVYPETRELGSLLKRRAETTAGRAAALDVRGFWHQVEVSQDSVCGAKPITVLLQLLHHAFTGRGQVLHVSTSDEVSQDWQQVVTYVATGFFGQWRAWRDLPPAASRPLDGSEQKSLLELARAVMETHLTRREQVAHWFATHPLTPAFLAPLGAFVTLHTRWEKKLRGCIGLLEPIGTLLDTVVRAAVEVLYDPRFPRVEAAELAHVEVEISVLSPPQPIPGPSAIRLGEHGVVLKKGRHNAVFLPQVAVETGWDLPTFLSRLAQKAGLPAEAWTSAEYAVFTAQVFGEGDLPAA